MTDVKISLEPSPNHLAQKTALTWRIRRSNSGLGDDIRTGGSGEDTFVLKANAGIDTITNFTQNYDVLGISAGGTFRDLAFAGNDILQKGSNNILATLSGFDTTQLTASDFVAV